MLGKNNKQYIKIQSCYDVHIGTGDDFMLNADFYIDNNKCNFLNIESIMNLVADDETMTDEHFDTIANATSLTDLSKMVDNVESLLSASYPITDEQNKELQLSKNKIKEQMNTSFGLPIIPGSSLKGAISTALYAQNMKANHTVITKDDIGHKELGILIF